jgi:rRNA maturation protein Nop10
MKKLRRCAKCGEYTLQEAHCGLPTRSAHPAKWSPADRFAGHRRRAREEGFA